VTATAPLDAVRAALRGREAWLVGGATRDRLLGRATGDLDLAVAGDPAPAARAIARAARGTAFPLSEAFGAWRVVGPGGAWQVDVNPVRGATIEEDLGARDLTLNAIAEPLHGGPLVDPHDGAGALRARTLRMVAPRAFADDPLRVIRVARLAVELDLDPEPATVAAARRAAPGLARVAPERVWAELRRIVSAPDPVRGVGLLEEVGAAAVVLPELEALRGVSQSVYHHLDVHDHTLAVLAETVALQRDPGAVLGESLDAGVRALLAEPLADELTRGDALRWGALLHDAAKPGTRVELPAGRVGFPGHDDRGAQLVLDVLRRLRASARVAAHVAALTRHHLRLGFLVHEQPLSRRAVYRYLRVTQPVEVDVSLLSVADRLATRGRKADEAIARHLALAREMVAEGLRFRAAPPAAPLRGDELARALRLRPGPRLGELLAELEEAAFAGEVSDPAGAVEWARRRLGSQR
jgi:tRNA nucleotidyltransferase/poly(A) polymerase